VSRAQNYLHAAAARPKAQYPGVTVELDVRLDERPGPAIVHAVQDHKADLVALTTHAHRGVRLVLGSVADKVLRGTDGALLELRPAAG